MRKLKDTDYLYISTRLKVLEKNMLTREKFSRLATSKTVSDALKTLEEFGWTGVSEKGADDLDEYLAKRRSEVLDLLYKYCPDRGLIDVFRLKYDYHNIKVFVKSQALGISGEELYSNDGVIPYKVLTAALRDKKTSDIPACFYDTAENAEDLLLRTRDPQLSDMFIDKALISHMQSAAKQSGGDFLNGYVLLYTDICNLRIALRALLADKDRSFRASAFLPGGSVDVSLLINENSAEHISKLFGKSDCSQALEEGLNALRGDGDLSSFDKAADKALLSYVDKAKLIPFGEAQVISYLINTENEHNSVRTVILCKELGMDADEIMERLRNHDL